MSNITDSAFTSSPFFEMLESALQDDEIRKKAINAIKGTLVLTLVNSDKKKKSWVVDLKESGKVVMQEKPPAAFDVQLTLADEDFMKLALNEVNGQKMFMSGKIKMKGNMMKAMKIDQVFKAMDPRSKM